MQRAASLLWGLSVALTLASPRSARAGEQPAGASAGRPIRVLVRTLVTGDIALDGAAFLDLLTAGTRSAAPELKQELELSSGDGLEAHEDRCIKLGKAAGEVDQECPEWKTPVAGFDFLVRMNAKYSERTKSIFNEALVMGVSEEWVVRRVGQPEEKKEWRFEYRLDGPREISGEAEGARLASQALVLGIAPLRGAVLRELRWFVGIVPKPCEPPLAYDAQDAGVAALALSGDGKTLVVAKHKAIRISSFPGGALLGSIEAQAWEGSKARAFGSPIHGLAVTRDGRTLASALVDEIKLWALPERRLLATRMDSDLGAAIALSSDGTVLASTGSGGTVKLWRLPELTLMATLKGHEYGGTSLVFSSDGKLLASGGADGAIRLWLVPEGTLLATLVGHDGTVSALAMTPDGRELASSGFLDGTIRLWSVADRTVTKIISGQWGVGPLAVTADGRTLVSAGTDRTLRIWSLPSGERVATLRTYARVTSLALGSDGTTLVVGGERLATWNLPRRCFERFLASAPAANPDP